MFRSALITCTCLIILCASLSTSGIENQEQAETKPRPDHPLHCVIFHTPGPNWKEGVPFQEQPGIMEHIQYMAKQLQERQLVMGGPFLDNSGGMMICTTADTDQAKAIANADPAVKAGLLLVEVKLWMVPMSSVQPK